MKTGRTVLTVLGVLALAMGSTETEAQEESFEWSGELDRGDVLEVRGITGNIRAVLATGTTAEGVAEKHGRRGDFEDVEIRVVEDRGGVTICALYGEWNHGRDDCDHDGDRRHRGDRSHRIDVDVDFVVRLPAGVEFIGAMVSGDVEVEDVRSEVTATSVSGDVFVSTSEVAWGTTVSGSIDIEMGSSDWDDLEFNTVSGDITLTLPAGLEADVDFSSLSGDLDSDFDIRTRGRQSRRWIGARVSGTIGDGGRSLSFHTVSGDVVLRRSR